MGLRLDPGTDETSSLVLLNDKSSGGSAHQQKHETACCPGPRLCQRGTNMWDERGGCSLASYLHSFPCVDSERNQQTQENKQEESGQAGESQAGNDFLPFPPTKFQSNRWVSSTGAGVFLLQSCRFFFSFGSSGFSRKKSTSERWRKPEQRALIRMQWLKNPSRAPPTRPLSSWEMRNERQMEGKEKRKADSAAASQRGLLLIRGVSDVWRSKTSFKFQLNVDKRI